MSSHTAEAKRIADAQPPHDTIAAALVAALADLTVVEKGRTAKIEMKGGGSYSYDFADLADIVKLTRPVLAAHGLVALTPVHNHGDGLACTVKILHAHSGDSLDLGPFPFPHGRDAQATGSMVTYHRRYALVAALGMAAGDDDDGAAAKPAPARPSGAAGATADLLNALPSEVRDRIVTDVEGRSGGSLAAALKDDGWRNWIVQAIEHHKKKAGE